MNIRIAKTVFRQEYIPLQIGFIVIRDMNNHKSTPESLHLLHEAEHLTQLTFNKDNVKSHALIAPWTVAQMEFGEKAQHYHTSVEQLLRKVIAKKKLASKDTLTNIVRYLSLRHIIPLGVDDLDKIKGNIVFDLAKRRQRVRLFRSLKPNELYYHDRKSILGTKLDYWKNSRTRVTPQSHSALLHCEALPPLTSAKLRSVLQESAQLIEQFTGARTKIFILSKRKPSARF